MLPFGVFNPATEPQRSEIPGIMNYTVFTETVEYLIEESEHNMNTAEFIE